MHVGIDIGEFDDWTNSEIWPDCRLILLPASFVGLSPRWVGGSVLFEHIGIGKSVSRVARWLISLIHFGASLAGLYYIAHGPTYVQTAESRIISITRRADLFCIGKIINKRTRQEEINKWLHRRSYYHSPPTTRRWIGNHRSFQSRPSYSPKHKSPRPKRLLAEITLSASKN